MEAIPLQSGVEVTMAAPPPSGAGKENEITAPKSPARGAYDSPAWSRLEENEGATLSSTNMVTETEGEEA
jgi:hypothetical protein